MQQVSVVYNDLQLLEVGVPDSTEQICHIIEDNETLASCAIKVQILNVA